MTPFTTSKKRAAVSAALRAAAAAVALTATKAAVYDVSPDGTPMSLTEALNVAGAGDTIALGDGIYREPIVTMNAGEEGNPLVIEGGKGAVINYFSGDRSLMWSQKVVDIRHSWITLRVSKRVGCRAVSDTRRARAESTKRYRERDHRRPLLLLQTNLAEFRFKNRDTPRILRSVLPFEPSLQRRRKGFGSRLFFSGRCQVRAPLLLSRTVLTKLAPPLISRKSVCLRVAEVRHSMRCEDPYNHRITSDISFAPNFRGKVSSLDLLRFHK